MKLYQKIVILVIVLALAVVSLGTILNGRAPGGPGASIPSTSVAYTTFGASGGTGIFLPINPWQPGINSDVSWNS